ncbi:hypothetical protein [uncultured Demequina sp.]|uniref:hypothetical protein n=1 Tax=uncultured Demequina sp. TaxID=693499 RepID=UPI0025E73B06|nr:hypothetical protein [uncultured Demequina sp.]
MSRTLAVTAVTLGGLGLFAGTAVAAATTDAGSEDDSDTRGWHGHMGADAEETQAQLEQFAQCLRDNGIDVPEIDEDDERPLRGARWGLRGELRAEALANPEDFADAREACGDLAPEGPLRGHRPLLDRDEAQGLMIECLREEGISSTDATELWEEAFDTCHEEVRDEWRNAARDALDTETDSASADSTA